MNRLLAARSYYRFLCEIGRRDDDPTARLPVKRDHLEPEQPFSNAELSLLVRAARTPRDRALILILIGSGCRRAEVAGLKAQDIVWVDGRILINGKGGKQRWVSPGPAVLAALRRYLGRRIGLVWLVQGHPMTGLRLYKIVQRIGRRAGVERCHPHRFRVTFANAFLQAGGDLQALQYLLGHSSVTTTAHYAGYSAAQRALAQQRLGQPKKSNLPGLPRLADAWPSQRRSTPSVARQNQPADRYRNRSAHRRFQQEGDARLVAAMSLLEPCGQRRSSMEVKTDAKTDAKTELSRRRRGEAGFTLVEVLIVLAILAILAAIILPNFTGLLSGSQTTAGEAELVIVQTAVDAKMADQDMATTTAITIATTDMTTASGGFGLSPTYMRGTATKGTYTVDTTGKVTQASTGY